MVIVVDEYGNTAGPGDPWRGLGPWYLHRRNTRAKAEPGSDVTQEEDGSFVVSGSFDVARLNDLFDFKPQEEAESTTVGGLLSEWLGRVPVAGESVERDGIHAEVVAGKDAGRAKCSSRETSTTQPQEAAG